jgi:hypothetical protein
MAEIGQMPDDDDGLYVYGNAAYIPKEFEFKYVCFEEISEVGKSVLSATEFNDVIVVREEYKLLLRMLEQSNYRKLIVTGQPGIGG